MIWAGQMFSGYYFQFHYLASEVLQPQPSKASLLIE